MKRLMTYPTIMFLLLFAACSKEVSKPNESSSKTEIKQKEKFGLSKARRREIFDEYFKLQSEAYAIAVKKYPARGLNRFNSDEALLEKRRALTKTILKQPREQIAAKHNLSVEHIDKIHLEGIKKGWGIANIKPKVKPELFDKNWRIPKYRPVEENQYETL